MMRRLLIFCVLLIVTVYADVASYSNEVEDENELSEDIDSPESFEYDALGADINNIFKWTFRDRYLKDKKNPHEHSKETKSSKESKDILTISDDAIVLAHEKYCQYFYLFNGLEANLVSCSKKYHFDAKKLQCLKSKEVNCDKRKKKVDGSEEKKARINFKCPKWSGLHQHEYYCHLYYNCQNKKGRLFMCPKGMLFDNYNKRCDNREKVNCNKRIDPNGDEQRPTVKPKVFACPSNSGKYPHERDCSAFYRCDDRKFKIQYCPKGKLYDERKRKCESENKVTCGSRIHPDQDPEEPEDEMIDPNPNFNCLENFGRYNHNQYCNWYYQCHDRRPSVRGCRRGWRYHSHRRRCREKLEVTCDGKPDYEDATTDKITTTSIFTESETFTPSETKTSSVPETTPSETETPYEPETTSSETKTTPTEPETTTPTPTEPETTTPTPTEPETTTPTPTEPETTTPTATEPETTITPTEQETTTTPTEAETTITPTEQETTTTPTEAETTTLAPTEQETTTTTTEELTTTKPPITAPDTDCDENDVDCIIDDLGITPDWFVCPEDIGSYPHPSSRKLFIFCLNWKPSVKKCGQELLYSEDLRTCVHP